MPPSGKRGERGERGERSERGERGEHGEREVKGELTIPMGRLNSTCDFIFVPWLILFLLQKKRRVILESANKRNGSQFLSQIKNIKLHKDRAAPGPLSFM